MSLANAQEIGEAVLELGLVKPEDWAAVWPAVAEKAPEDIYTVLQARSLLTGLQVDKLRKGDTFGYSLGRFKLLYKISAGTFARVYRGVDTNDGAVVAVKVLRQRHAMSPESVKQFHREAKLTEQLDHPNIVRTLDVGTEEETGQHYIAMEFVEGGNLRELLRIRKSYSPQEVVRTGLQMVDGLGYALSRGVTHRDIKPTNILFTTTGQIKWVDFGLAGFNEAKGLAFGKLDDVQQQRTVDYAGLEKLTGAPKGDFRSDIFFLGNVFYMMLTGYGALPETKDRRERMEKSRFDAIVPLVKNPDVPRALAVIVDKMLALKLDARYQSYDDILRDLRAVETLFASGKGLERGEEAGLAADGFPPGPPRVMFVHEKEKLFPDVKAKLEKHGYQVVCNSDLGRAVMLHDLKPFHALIFDLASVGKAGVRAYVKAKNAADDDGRKVVGVFLANSSGEAALTADLIDDLSITLRGQPVTLAQVREALAKLLPGATVKKDPKSQKTETSHKADAKR